MENKISYETLINNVLDEIDQRRSLCGVGLPEELESKYSIIERCCKKVHEDTKKRCLGIIEEGKFWGDGKLELVEKLKKEL